MTITSFSGHPLGAILAVPTVRVRSEEVNASADVARLQAFHERVTVHAARTLINTHYKEMARVSVRPRGPQNPKTPETSVLYFLKKEYVSHFANA